jgi:hypothetical protein
MKEALLALLSTALGLISIWLQEWRKERGADYRKRQTLIELKERVEFIRAWIQAQEACDTGGLRADKTKAQDQLNAVYETWLSVQGTRTEAGQRLSARRILLLYRPHTIQGWIAHTLFYIWIVLMQFFVLGVILDWKAGDIPAVILATITGLVILLVLRAWAVNADADRASLDFHVAEFA